MSAGTLCASQPLSTCPRHPSCRPSCAGRPTAFSMPCNSVLRSAGAALRPGFLHLLCPPAQQSWRQCYSTAQTATPATAAAAPELLLTLERSVGASSGTDSQLRACGAFGAEVFPDLPAAATWRSLLRGAAWLRGGPSAPPGQEAAGTQECDATTGVLKVVTVAAQLRSRAALRERIVAATGRDGGSSGRDEPAAGSKLDERRRLHLGDQPAGALLCVSGSHPARSLPFASRVLSSSLDSLRMAGDMRRAGDIPAEVALWAVANPNLEEDASLLERKVELGATTILTQPPFDWPAFLRWLDDAQRRGLTQQAKLVIGMPMISSPGNLAFWLTLSGCSARPECVALAARFTEAAAAVATETAPNSSATGKSAPGVDGVCRQYNQDLFRQVGRLPGVGGCHLMPITPKSKRWTLDLLSSTNCLPAV